MRVCTVIKQSGNLLVYPGVLERGEVREVLPPFELEVLGVDDARVELSACSENECEWIRKNYLRYKEEKLVEVLTELRV